MSETTLTPALTKKLQKLFPESDWDTASELLSNQCSRNLPLMDRQTAGGLERVQAAVLKLSEGSLDKLKQAIEVAKIDWRDSLVGAGFGHKVDAHQDWLKTESLN